MGEFPSGQRGQTVNLLRFASMVRIRPPPPNKHRNFDTKITVLIFDYLPKTMDFQYFCVKFRAAVVLSRSGYSCLWNDCHIARL